MTKEISERRAEPAPGVLNKLQGSTLRILEDVFQFYGEFVARHPVLGKLTYAKFLNRATCT